MNHKIFTEKLRIVACIAMLFFSFKVFAGESAEIIEYNELKRDAYVKVTQQAKMERFKKFGYNTLAYGGMIATAALTYVGYKYYMGGDEDSDDLDREMLDLNSQSFLQKMYQKGTEGVASYGPGIKKAAVETAGTYLTGKLAEAALEAKKVLVGVFVDGQAFDPELEYKVASHIAEYFYEHRLLSAKHKVYIEKNLEEVELLLNSAEKDISHTKKVIRNILEGLDCVFRLPKTLKKIDANPEFNAKLKKVIKNYPEEFQSEIKKIIGRIIAHSNSEGAFTPRKVIPFFLGAPGTGKTYLAIALAELLDLPFVEISFANVDDLSKIFGSENIGHRNNAPLAYFSGPSMFTRTMLDAKASDGKNYKNMIVFVDEVDRLVNHPEHAMMNPKIGQLQNILLKLLDPDRSELELLDLGLDFDISHCIFILTGNFRFQDNALGDRVKIFNFPGFSKEKKIAIAKDRLEALAKARRLKISQLELDRIDLFAENDESEGVRRLLAEVDSIVDELNLQIYDWSHE